MKGDSVNLSIAYIARMMLEEQALEYYFAQGKKNISLRGTAPMLIHYIDKYGAQPYDSYEDPKHVNYKVLCRKVQKLCDGAILKKAGISQLKEELNDLFDFINRLHAPYCTCCTLYSSRVWPLESVCCIPRESRLAHQFLT